MNKKTPAAKVKIDEISEIVKKRIPEEEREHFSILTSILFNHISIDDINNYKDEDLQGLIVNLYRHVQSPPSVKKSFVFNPNVEEHNWQNAHTIVFVHHRDVRYLIDSVRNAFNQEDIKIHTIFHAYITVTRNKAGKITALKETKQ